MSMGQRMQMCKIRIAEGKICLEVHLLGLEQYGMHAAAASSKHRRHCSSSSLPASTGPQQQGLHPRNHALISVLRMADSAC